MLFGKKKNNSLFSEVDDVRHIVYDFRRRTNELFENYRAVSYKKSPVCDLARQKEENARILEKFVSSQTTDAGNADCLLDQILGPAREGIRYLEDQSLEHMDFYSRQAGNMAIHSADLAKILEMCREKEKQIEEEHEFTCMLWNRYRGFDQEVKKHER
ncbi:MAG: hypothetical protein Q4F28_10840 [Eubacteriales bacterium]|nr:hypothetical protein [Eubacteriales bacterium]